MDDPKGCLPCKLRGWAGRGFQLSPAATPTRTRTVGPVGPKGNNSWERQVITDGRGMPIMHADGELIRTKEYAEKRTEIESGRRRLAQEASAISP